MDEQELVREILWQNGRMSFAELEQEAGISREDLFRTIRALFDGNKVNGYVNWRLEIVEALRVPENTWLNSCPGCGDSLPDAPRGKLHCAHCGAEIYRSVDGNHAVLVELEIMKRFPPRPPYLEARGLLERFTVSAVAVGRIPKSQMRSFVGNPSEGSIAEGMNFSALEIVQIIGAFVIWIPLSFVIISLLTTFLQGAGWSSLLIVLPLVCAITFIILEAVAGSIYYDWSLAHRPSKSIRDWETKLILFYLNNNNSATTIEDVVEKTGVSRERVSGYIESLKESGAYKGRVDS